MKTILRVFSALLLVSIFFCPVPLKADTTIPVNMADMTAKADRIFKGICTAATPGKNGGLDVITYTFQVLEVLKGDVPNPFQFTQWTVKGAPIYQPNDEVLLFLNKTSKRGLSSTIGNEQGKFLVIQKEGKSQVVNGRNNIDLFGGAKTKGLSKAMGVGGVSPDASGPIDEESFKKMINALK